jgi:hypothetical protein
MRASRFTSLVIPLYCTLPLQLAVRSEALRG